MIIDILRMMREAEQVAARLQTERGPSAATLKAFDGAGLPQ